MSIKKIITCILYVPILEPSGYQYSKIYPIPSSESKILIPPATYNLYNAKAELWTEERCKKLSEQTICVRDARTNKCALFHNISECSFALVNNNYDVHTQLEDGKIIVSSKQNIPITEECKDKINTVNIKNSAIISSSNDCKISIKETTYENTHSNITFEDNLKPLTYNTRKTVALQSQHLEDIHKLKEEAQELNDGLPEIHPATHYAHFSMTLFIVICICVIIAIWYIKIHNPKASKIESNPTDLEELETITSEEDVRNEDVLF